MKRRRPQKNHELDKERPCYGDVYDPVYKCIYCGNEGSKLSNEHILMFALGGTKLLPKASCKKCAEETGRVEQFISRDMWGAARAAMKFPTRNTKQHDGGYPVIAGVKGMPLVRFKLPVEKIPYFLNFPILPPPAFFSGVPLGEFSAIGLCAEPEKMMQFGGQRVYGGAVNLQTFARFLAKTAHALACAQFGETFAPLLLDAILGRTERSADFIGSISTDLPAESEYLHRLELVNVEQGGHHYIAARIRLFCYLGAPEYLVVVGHNGGPPHPVFARKLALGDIPPPVSF